MALTPAAEAYLSDPNAEAIYSLTVSFPSGTRRFAEVDFGSDSRGIYDGRIKSISDMGSGYGDWRAGLQGRQVSVVVDDLDGEMKAILEGRNDLFGSGARVDLTLPGLPTSDWPVCFLGMFDHAEQRRSGEYTLMLRTNDRQLQRGLNIPVITAVHAPYAVSPTIGGCFPVAYGRHDSRAMVGTVDGVVGSIPCLYLGEYPGPYFRYSPSMGQMFHIQSVFADGVFQASSGYTKEILSLGGVLATVVRFPSSMGNAKITVDGIGLHPDMSLATQDPYTTPTAIMRHILNNFVFGLGWRGGSFFPDVFQIDTASWDAADAYCIRQDIRASLLLHPADSATRAIDLLQDFAAKHGFRLYWTDGNKLAVAVRDQSPSAIYVSGVRWLDAGHLTDPGAVGRPKAARDDVEALRAEVWGVASQSEARSKVTVAHPGTAATTVEDRPSRWGEACRYLDRNMIAGAGIKVASPAFAIGRFAGGAGMKNGALVSTWNGHSNGFNTRYDWTAAGAARPTLKLGLVNARPGLSFDGTANVMALSTTVANVLTDTAFEVIVVFRARTISTNSANPYDNECLITDSGNRFGLHLRNNAGACTVNGWVHDGAYKVPTAKSIDLNTWYLVRLRLSGGFIYLALDNVLPENTVACGTMSSTAFTPQIGANGAGSQFFDGDIAEVHLYSTGFQSTVPWTFATPGGGSDWETSHAMMREYGIA